MRRMLHAHLDASPALHAAGSRVDVVIASRDRRALLLQTLARLHALPAPPAVVVVDDGSRDGTAAAVAARFPGVEVARLAASRGAAARNVGVERSGAPYVALTDDDAHWAPGALERAAQVLDLHPEVALVAPRVLVGPEERLDPVCRAMLVDGLRDAPWRPGRPVLGFVACAAVVRRSAFLAVGGFDGRYGMGGEEGRLALDLAGAGWELRHVPSVVAHHHPPPRVGCGGRSAPTLRNDLWTAWLRRPARAALAQSVRYVRASGLRRETGSGVLGAIAGAGWVLRERRVVPEEVEGALVALDRARRAHPAR